jgi:hypothetical protein
MCDGGAGGAKPLPEGRGWLGQFGAVVLGAKLVAAATTHLGRCRNAWRRMS